ncbi:hypothetical protein BDV24DRAFT_165229 [Aspergillus arachidicola]|uniref:Uncharacterized protein n=1 Tax=Aspergillus arachidicola TaxID=656916 RepID=A0A5N6Y208_9EURO|nr:hypothetical protein BDV24DRAFT_165229 [Aspergillus arachidicola]
MARLLVIILFYLAALAAGQHIHTHEERGRPMFWSKEELHSLCQNVVVSEQRPRQGKPQTFLRASCKTKRQARASEPWVTSIINLDQCLGWDERQQNFTSKAGIVEWGLRKAIAIAVATTTTGSSLTQSRAASSVGAGTWEEVREWQCWNLRTLLHLQFLRILTWME